MILKEKKNWKKKVFSIFFDKIFEKNSKKSKKQQFIFFNKNHYFSSFFRKIFRKKMERIFFIFFFLYYGLTFILQIHKAFVYSIEWYTLILICTFCHFWHWKWRKIENFEKFCACCHYINNNFFDSFLMLSGYATAIFYL